MPVVVIARCDILKTIPLCIVWEDREYPIERVLDRRRDVLRKTGAIAVRYTVRMRKQQHILWQDSQNRWYIEPADKKPPAHTVHCCSDLK